MALMAWTFISDPRRMVFSSNQMLRSRGALSSNATTFKIGSNLEDYAGMMLESCQINEKHVPQFMIFARALHVSKTFLVELKGLHLKCVS